MNLWSKKEITVLPPIQLQRLILWLGLIMIAVVGLSGCNADMLHARAPVRIKDPWLRWYPETNSGELYLYLTNPGPVDETLLGAWSEAASAVEIYNALPGKQLTEVEQVSSIKLPVKSGLILLPDGPHLKLVGLSDVTPGQIIPITLKFEQAGEFSFYVEAR